MKRGLRWGLNGLTILSLMICLAAVALWVDGYSRAREWQSTTGGGVSYAYNRVASYDGSLYFSWQTGAGGTPPVANIDTVGIRVITNHEYRGFRIVNREFTAWDRNSKIVATGGRFGEVVLPDAWLAALALLLPTAWAAATLLRRLRPHPRADSLCPVCGYDLRASPTRCPECGTAAPPPVA